MRISYASGKVEKYFTDYRAMQKVIPLDWVRTVKKRIDHLKAAACFGDFLQLGLGHPERLQGSERWSLRVSANARLIILPNEIGDAVMLCEEICVEGVVDYHGDKDTWYIP